MKTKKKAKKKVKKEDLCTCCGGSGEIFDEEKELKLWEKSKGKEFHDKIINLFVDYDPRRFDHLADELLEVVCGCVLPSALAKGTTTEDFCMRKSSFNQRLDWYLTLIEANTREIYEREREEIEA